jgi:glycosyltransferase involved in cell wall biosynthesis
MDSVLGQKADGVEYIAVDPGSTDASRAMLSKTRGIDRLILEPDAGPADGLNKGFSAATGDIFGYINADDRVAPGAIGFVRRYFSTYPQVDVLCGAIRIFDEEGRVALRARTADAFDLRRYAAGICVVGQQATFFRRAAFEKAGGFRVANRIAWDGELLVDLCLTGARFATTHRILGDFRVYRGTISNSEAYRKKHDDYYRDLDRKLRDRSVTPFPPMRARLARLAYKFNAWRHLGNVLVRLTNHH